ncbi:hypothetical protein KAR91_66640 [Candidatus Pacearchaeota archaeon]|nr:hypothetical protein [Candidatus Pacearchaeota archaeon]
MAERRVWKCTFYDDPDTLEILGVIDMGEIWAGETVQKTVWLRNDENFLVRDITYAVSIEDVIVNGPKVLTPRQIGPVDITWSPQVDIESGLLDSFIVTGTLVT